MLRKGSTPLRFAHSSGALSLDQAARAAIGAAFQAFDRPPVVLQATSTLDAGNLGAASLWAAEATIIAGGRALVAASGGTPDRLRRIGAEFHDLPLEGRGLVAAGRGASRLRRLIEEQGVDIVHARSREIAWAARQACRGLDAVVVTSCGVDRSFVDAARDGGAAIDGECIVAGSAHVRDVIARYDEEKGDRVAVIPDGVDLAVFSPEAISAERLARLARGWGMLEEPTPTVLAPGAIEPLRGQHVLARAFGPLAADPDYADVVAVVAGDAGRKNSYAEQLGWIVRRGGASGRVFLSPQIEDLPAAMMLADIIVSLPMEPLGQDPTAAMATALGKPVVGANHGATAEVVQDGVTGRLVSPTNPDAVTAALREMLDLTSMERTRLASLARARAEAYFSSKAAALATIRLYVALLASTRR